MSLKKKRNWVKRCESIGNYESSKLRRRLGSIFEQLDFPRIPLVSDVSSFEGRSLADPDGWLAGWLVGGRAARRSCKSDLSTSTRSTLIVSHYEGRKYEEELSGTSALKINALQYERTPDSLSSPLKHCRMNYGRDLKYCRFSLSANLPVSALFLSFFPFSHSSHLPFHSLT